LLGKIAICLMLCLLPMLLLATLGADDDTPDDDTADDDTTDDDSLDDDTLNDDTDDDTTDDDTDAIDENQATPTHNLMVSDGGCGC